MAIETYYRADFEEEFQEIHTFTIAECKEKGQDDGRRNLPLVDTTFLTPFENGIINKYQSFIEGIASKGGQFLQELFDNEVHPKAAELERLEKNPKYIEDKLGEEHRELQRRLQQANESHQDKLKVIENEPSWLESKQKFIESKDRFHEVTKKIGRKELHVSLSKWVYLSIIFAIGIAELPINYQVFVSFRETPLLTLIMACILVIALPILAHFSGKFIRQYKENKAYLFLLTITVVGITSLSYFTALLRRDYLSQKAGTSMEELTSDFWTFFIISMIIYLVGSLAAFFAHDPSIEFTHVDKSYKKQKYIYDSKAIAKYKIENEERSRYDNEIESYKQEFTGQRQKIENLNESLRKELAESSSKHDKALEYFVGLEKRISESCKEAINIYRDQNLTYRNNHKQPVYWQTPISELNFRINRYKEVSPNPKDHD